MHTLLKYTLIMALLCSACLQRAAAQEAETGNWFIYVGNQSFEKRWNWWNEVQYRNYNFAGDLQQMLLRTGIGYNLSENNNNLLVGYAYIYGRQYITDDSVSTSEEHRLFQQFITRQQFGRFYLQHRYRLEERNIQDDPTLRFRYLLGINIPLNKKTMTPGAVYGSVYNEIFLNTDAPNFDRNRLYGAVGYVFTPYVRAEVGFMSQMLSTTHRNQFQIAVFNNIPFRQPQD